MATTSKKKAQPGGVTAAGIVEAIEQDLELSIEQVKDAVVAAEEKLGVRKPPAKPKAKAPLKSGAPKAAPAAKTKKPR